MAAIDVTVVVTTHNRPGLLRRAVESALGQTYRALEVLVVDDGSSMAVEPFADERVRVIRHGTPHGSAAARNAGLEAARGRWVTFLDDDDWLLPHMVEISLQGLASLQGRRAAMLPPPVAVLSGLEVVDRSGHVLATKLPPTCPRGTAFGIEAVPGFPPGPAYETKQTLVIERELLRSTGGWAEGFQPRETTELFLRLCQRCSMLGLPVTTYKHLHHREPRLGSDLQLREQSFERLVRRHGATFEAHPRGYAHQLRGQARFLRRAGAWGRSLRPLGHALRLDPATTIASTPGSLSRDAVAAIQARRRRARGAR